MMMKIIDLNSSFVRSIDRSKEWMIDQSVNTCQSSDLVQHTNELLSSPSLSFFVLYQMSSFALDVTSRSVKVYLFNICSKEKERARKRRRIALNLGTTSEAKRKEHENEGWGNSRTHPSMNRNRVFSFFLSIPRPLLNLSHVHKYWTEKRLMKKGQEKTKEKKKPTGTKVSSSFIFLLSASLHFTCWSSFLILVFFRVHLQGQSI